MSANDTITYGRDNLHTALQASLDDACVKIGEQRLVIKELRAELQEARDSILGWAAYASEYFRDKHDLDGDIARIDAVLAKSKSTGEA